MITKYVSFILFFTAQANAWQEFDYNKENFIEIEKENLVRERETIEFYEYGEGYSTLDIDEINRYGSHVEISGIDNETDKIRIFGIVSTT